MVGLCEGHSWAKSSSVPELFRRSPKQLLILEKARDSYAFMLEAGLGSDRRRSSKDSVDENHRQLTIQKSVCINHGQERKVVQSGSGAAYFPSSYMFLLLTTRQKRQKTSLGQSKTTTPIQHPGTPLPPQPQHPRKTNRRPQTNRVPRPSSRGRQGTAHNPREGVEADIPRQGTVCGTGCCGSGADDRE